MGVFGKSETELKQIAAGLEMREAELEKRERDLTSAWSNIQREEACLAETKDGLDSEKSAFLDNAKREREDIASEKAALEALRIENVKREAEAKAGFAGQQREAFKEVIEKRIAEQDAHQRKLEHMTSQLAERSEKTYSAEAEIARRELAVTEREQKADAGFADKVKALADEAARQYQSNQAEAERLRKLADGLGEERQRLEEDKARLASRERDVIAAEQKRDMGFADERAALDAELRDKHAKANAELENYRVRQLSAIDEAMGAVRDRRLEEVEKTAEAERARVKAEIAAERESVYNERAEMERRKGAVNALQSELEGRKYELELNERTLELKEQRLEQKWQKRSEELNDEIESRIDEERQSMEAEKRSYSDENVRLRESIRVQTELDGVFDQLTRQLGGRDPAEILRELNGKTDELKRLREELVTRPTEADRERYREMEAEAGRQRARIEELTKWIDGNAALVADTNELRRKNGELEAENKMLAQKSAIFEGMANEAQAELERHYAAYERSSEESARIRDIELPYIKADKVKKPPQKNDSIDEIIWLTGVENACCNYGLHFHPRILKAFHTALKTAEWSPLTILAGVSGTGKSELPRLYSHFGGLMFEPLSVQPNWDSQESMLGFFNSIDNKFDAQPVLRFLAQSQKPWVEKTGEDEGYPGLQDAVCLVLLDEMNLAYPELYFAEFLSKLELRRGLNKTDAPYLPVKIGAGMSPYELKLGRNVLWTGTMNQDETTKSLSDKVLDRSIIIHFPRPAELKRRQKLTQLDESSRGPLLHKNSWLGWVASKSSFDEKDIQPFKKFLEDMNTYLEAAGRAIGHRVWQSVEYYMANYPDVRAAKAKDDKDAFKKALHTAFEDQLVQKVMPKLRGIDTRGDSKTKCLEKIRGQLNAGIYGKPFNLAEDFDRACELGYGQFIWQSANYLKEDLPSGKDDYTPGEGQEARA